MLFATTLDPPVMTRPCPHLAIIILGLTAFLLGKLVCHFPGPLPKLSSPFIL